MKPYFESIICIIVGIKLYNNRVFHKITHASYKSSHHWAKLIQVIEYDSVLY